MNQSKNERNQKICNLYKNNYRVMKIANILNISKGTVTRVLKKYNLYDERKNISRINPDKIKRNLEIIKLYFENKMSMREIAKIKNIGHTTVNDIIKKFLEKEIIQYPKYFDELKNQKIRHRKYIFNEDFFNIIDTEEKAYWLGFIYADGCLYENSLRIELQLRDIEILKKFKKDIGAYDSKIKINYDKQSCQIILNSKINLENLFKHGCYINKTFKIKFPTKEQIPDNLIHHFMRGYFDGDGCIYSRKNNVGINTFSVVGNLDFITGYKKRLFESINKKNDIKLQNHNSKIYTLYLGGNKQLKKIYDFLYKDAKIFLNRKYNKWNEILK